MLHDRLGVVVVKEDEIATIVNGISFLLENSSGPGELYAIEHSRSTISSLSMLSLHIVQYSSLSALALL